MGLLKHNLLILRVEVIGVGNNSTRLNRKFTYPYISLDTADMN